MNDKEIKQQKLMSAAFDDEIQSQELSDELLDLVTGGAMMTGHFYVVKCDTCGWSFPLPTKDSDNMHNAVIDHIATSPNCEGHSFGVHEFNK